ncbi:MAG: hypothetical protein ABR529_05270 [Actinomycetota bacterium]
MLGREEVASYEELFSSLEWQAMVTGDWSLLDEDDEDGEEVAW